LVYLVDPASRNYRRRESAEPAVRTALLEIRHMMD